MLRLVVVLLLMANGAYYAWAQGHLAPWGLGPAPQSEPQRQRQQINPEAVRIGPPEELARLAAPVAARPSECLQAGPLDEAVARTLQSALDTWPAGSWSLEPAPQPARWIVYLGKYPAAESVERKKAELRSLGVSFEPLANAAFEPGLSLGGHATQAAAEQQLQALSERGVRTARVVQERPELRGVALRLPALDDRLRTRLDELRSALGSAHLRPCR